MLRVNFNFNDLQNGTNKTVKPVIEFYKLDFKKGHGYTYNQWKREKKQRQKEIDHDIVIQMFEDLKGRIHLAKESGDGLSSLIKF